MTTTNTTTAPVASTITIIKTSQRGAHLITDGIRVAWVQGRSVRADGSLTPSGITALQEGKTYAEWEQEEERRRLWAEDREKARELAFQEGKTPTSVSLPAVFVREGSEKSWKIRTKYTQVLYGKVVAKWEYVPKSVVSVSIDNGVATLTMPKWFLNKNGWLSEVATA